MEDINKIPERERWLYQNPEALALIDKGMSEVGSINRGSFADYIDDAEL